MSDVVTATAAVEVSPKDQELFQEVEKSIGEIVRRAHAAVTPADVARTIGEHTKAIISRTTAESRGRISSLFNALQEMDEFLADNERKLRAAIDQHISIANSAQNASDILQSTISGWKEDLSTKTPQAQ